MRRGKKCYSWIGHRRKYNTCLPFARWINKATYAHWEYVIMIPFLPQRWLSERALMLRYTYIACLVKFISFLS
jgi:hypothetical protein